jgi:biopolymer transport protein ExbD
MADVQANNNAYAPKGKVRSKKMSTKIDFTPMVDLGFLLITFFMLTTTLAKPNVMALVMPEKDVPLDDLKPLDDTKALTLLLGAKDKVYYYEGLTNARLDSTDYTAEGLRKVILANQARVDALYGTETRDDIKHPGQTKQISKLNVLIKPLRESCYKNLVDALDEMKICHVGVYVLLDVSPSELAFLKNPIAGLHFSEAEQAQAVKRAK